MINWRKLVFALLCASVILAPALADARAGASARSSGGTSYSSQGSMGSRTYNDNGAQPVQRSATPQTGASASAIGGQPGFMQQHPFLTGIFGGIAGSWIGSMLFPHWGMGGGFGGVFGSLFMWILIIVGVSMVFRMFRRGGAPLTVPSLGGSGMNYRAPQPGFSGGGARASALTVTATDQAAFEAILKAVQGAWSKTDLGELAHYVTPEMLGYFRDQLAGNNSQGVENHIEQVDLIKGDARESWDEGAWQYATCLLHWRALDYTVRTDRKAGEPGWLVDGDAQQPSEAQEVWTFTRNPGGHWLLSAIQQV